MKINFQNFYLFSVPVNFDIANLKILNSNHLVVKLGFQGKTGIGEGVLYQTSSLKTLGLLLNQFRDFFNQEFLSLKQARGRLYQAFSSFPGIVCDLEAKLKKKPLYQLLNKRKANKVSIAEQIFIPQNKIALIKEIEEIIKHKTKVIKLKTGRNLEQDLINLRLIKEMTGDKISLQVDLNQTLDFDQAVGFARKLKKLGILAWEEPIKFTHFNQLNQLKRRVKLPLILDESIKDIGDLKKAIENKAIDILNIKISRLGGITNSLQLIKLARRSRVKIEIGCSEELGIATSGQLHLATSLRGLRAMEVLGSLRLGFDLIKERQEIKNGFLKKPTRKPGLGVNFDLLKLRRKAKSLNFSVSTKTNSELPFKFYFDYFQTRLRSLSINGLLWLKSKILHLRGV